MCRSEWKLILMLGGTHQICVCLHEALHACKFTFQLWKSLFTTNGRVEK